MATTEMEIESTRSRLLGWAGCLNSRDLGGYPTADGRETRWGAVARSDRLTDLTPAGQDALVAHGIRTIVDLRMPHELRDYPNPFATPGDHGVRYVNISIIDPATEPRVFPTLADDYKDMLDSFAASFAGVISTIATAEEGGVLIHCMAGKDRTGLISAILLELAGVDRETIAADYALTAECLRPADQAWLENGPGERAEREAFLIKYAPTATVMRAVLPHFDDRYGGTEAYLRQAGVSADEIAVIRQRLVASASE